MSTLLPTALDVLWRHALAAVPLAVLVAVCCRILRLRPSTRHALWLVVLAWIAVGPVLPVSSGPLRAAGAAPDSEAPAPGGTLAVQVTVEPSTAADTETIRAPSRPPRATWDGMPIGPRAPRTVAVAEHRLVDCKYHRARRWLSAAAPLSEFAREQASCRRHQIERSPTPLASSASASSTQPPGLQTHAASSRTAIVALSPTPAHPVARNATHSMEPAAVSAAPPPSWGRRLADRSLAFAVAWVDRLTAARDAFARLPALPAPIWLAGIAMIALTHLWRGYRFRRLLAGALQAPESIERQVHAAADRLGLSRRPEVLMVRSRVTPMIWSQGVTRPARLILPVPLWLELDAVGRNAVLFHELAHLKRRDHWVRMLGTCVGAVYWWHPLVWWVRHRLHEEAETCCDNWVTWLLPRGRRAYAEALLRTRQYISTTDAAMPATGIGIMTRRARRFSRRLTMVMTDANAPRLSAWGIVLVAVAVLTAWAIQPALACPPDKEPADAPPRAAAEWPAPPAFTGRPVPAADQPSALRNVQRPRALFMGQPDGEPRVFFGGEPAAHPPAGEWTAHPDHTTFEAHLAERRAERLEARLARLENQVAMLLGDDLPPPRPHGGALWMYLDAAGDDDEVIVRSYYLPKGKLKEFSCLMVRNDVPILVSPGDNHIDIHATEAQHAVFAAFMKLIHPEGEPHGRGHSFPPDAQDLQRELARRAALDERVAGMSVKMSALDAEARALQIRARQLEVQSEELDSQAHQLEARAEWFEKLSENMKGKERREALEKAEKLSSEARDLESRARDLEHEAQELAERMAELEGRAAEVEEEAEELRDRRDW